MTPGPRDQGRPRGAALLVSLVSSALSTGVVLLLVGGLILAFGARGGAGVPNAAEQPADPGLTAVSGPPPAADPLVDQVVGPVAATEPPVAEASPEPAARPEAPAVPVVVLNETKRRNLAATFGDVLTGAGWKVHATGNFRGNVPATTVYYPPGHKAEALALEKAFEQVNRIRPAFPGIPTDKLTVILCKDYPPA